MSVIDVVFEVPRWIEAGLADGSLERVGGVVRSTANKRTVAWLRDTGLELTRAKEGIPAPSQRLMEAVGLPLEALPALQLANIAVSAVGFAMVLHRLGEMDAKLDDILENLAKVGEDVAWVRDVLDVDLLSRLHAAARKLTLRVFEGASARLSVLHDLIELGETFDGRRSLMLSRCQALARSDLFDLYSEYLSQCVRLQLSLCWSLGSIESALELGRDWSDRLDLSAERLVSAIRTGERDIGALRTYAALGDERREAAVRTRSALLQSAATVHGHVQQLNLYSEIGVGPADLAAIDAAEPKRLAMLIVK